MGGHDRTQAASVEARVELRSGIALQFEVPQAVLERLEGLVQEGLRGAELCNAWLGEATPLDAPTRIHVYGTRSDGTLIDVSVECQERNSRPEI